MGGMRRGLLTVAFAVALVLCAAGVAQWVRVYLRSQGADYMIKVVAPVVAVVLVFGVLPLAADFRRKHRRESSERGRCRNCFYDLRGNVSGVCPECGTALAGEDDENIP